jgi:hypothetical protein
MCNQPKLGVTCIRSCIHIPDFGTPQNLCIHSYMCTQPKLGVTCIRSCIHIPDFGTPQNLYIHSYMCTQPKLGVTCIRSCIHIPDFGTPQNLYVHYVHVYYTGQIMASRSHGHGHRLLILARKRNNSNPLSPSIPAQTQQRALHAHTCTTHVPLLTLSAYTVSWTPSASCASMRTW